MARVNVYLPDELADGLAEVQDLNISATCQRALRKELTMMQTIAQSQEKMERIEVDVEDPKSSFVRTMAFRGRWLVEPSDEDAVEGCTYGVALTGRGRIAVWTAPFDGFAELEDFDNIDQMERSSQYPDVVVADARAALSGTTPVVELNI
jgi:hypothetical protein